MLDLIAKQSFELIHIAEEGPPGLSDAMVAQFQENTCMQFMLLRRASQVASIPWLHSAK